MHYVVGMLEGHWPSHFVSIAYSSHCFRWSFVSTTWCHSLFPHAVGREDYVHQGRSSRCVPRLQSLVRKELVLLGNNTLRTSKLGSDFHADFDLKEMTF
jgi:hypothetical protein